MRRARGAAAAEIDALKKIGVRAWRTPFFKESLLLHVFFLAVGLLFFVLAGILPALVLIVLPVLVLLLAAFILILFLVRIVLGMVGIIRLHHLSPFFTLSTTTGRA
jgi:hypothetical protein